MCDSLSGGSLGFGGGAGLFGCDPSADLEVKSVMTSFATSAVGPNDRFLEDISRPNNAAGAPAAAQCESPSPVIVRQIQHVLDDGEDEFVPVVAAAAKVGAVGDKLPATPSADSGFGGGNPSPPPSATTTSPSSTSGGDSPAPSMGHNSAMVAAAAVGGADGDFRCRESNYFPDHKGRSFNMMALAGPDSLIQPSEHIDMSTLQQAIALVQMGVEPTALDSYPSQSVGPSGDCSTIYKAQPDHYGEGGAPNSTNGGGSSNFANNLRALASLEQQQQQQFNTFRTASPDLHHNHSRPYGSNSTGGGSHQQLPMFQSQRSLYDTMDMRAQQQRQMPMQQQQQQLQRFYSEDFGYANAGGAAGFQGHQLPPPPPPQPRVDFYRKGSGFRGSNNSLASSDGGGYAAVAGNLSRLEINKGGLGKNPYAGLLGLNGAGLVPGMKAMQVRCKFGQLGQGEGQFNSPHGFCLGRNEEIVVADTHNHRIQVFDKDGIFKYMFGNQGKAEGCLWYPRKVAVLRHNGNFVVCDRGGERSRMQIFNSYGHFSHAISIRFIDIVAGLAINHEGHIVAVDSVTPTIFVLSEGGDLVRFHECSDFMKEPSDIGIFERNYYVCDFKDHNVVVVSEEGKLLRKIGNDHVTCFPNGIDISDAGDVLIGDSHGNKFHVAVYDKTANCVSQFECPHVKVSRCCGLKITSEGYIVTLAKNNHHVLVLDTIYIDKN